MRIIEDADLTQLTPAYEWDEWLTGRTIMLKRGEDFHIDPKHLIIYLRRKAKERGLQVTAKTNDATRTIVFKTFPEGTKKPYIPNALTVTTKSAAEEWAGKQILACKLCSTALNGGNMYLYGGYCTPDHQTQGEQQ